jgi:hypothetical protein
VKRESRDRTGTGEQFTGGGESTGWRQLYERDEWLKGGGCQEEVRRELGLKSVSQGKGGQPSRVKQWWAGLERQIRARMGDEEVGGREGGPRAYSSVVKMVMVVVVVGRREE